MLWYVIMYVHSKPTQRPPTPTPTPTPTKHRHKTRSHALTHLPHVVHGRVGQARAALCKHVVGQAVHRAHEVQGAGVFCVVFGGAAGDRGEVVVRVCFSSVFFMGGSGG